MDNPTGTVTVLLANEPPTGAMVIVPLYPPCGRFVPLGAVLTVTVMVCGVTPALGVIDNQVPPLLVEAAVVNPSAAVPPVFATVKVCCAGVAPGAGAVNSSEPALEPKADVVPVAIVNVTGIVSGVLEAPDAVTTMDPE